MVLADGSTKICKEIKIKIETPYISGIVNALVLNNPFADLIIGNIAQFESDTVSKQPFIDNEKSSAEKKNSEGSSTWTKTRKSDVTCIKICNQKSKTRTSKVHSRIDVMTNDRNNKHAGCKTVKKNSKRKSRCPSETYQTTCIDSGVISAGRGVTYGNKRKTLAFIFAVSFVCIVSFALFPVASTCFKDNVLTSSKPIWKSDTNYLRTSCLIRKIQRSKNNAIFSFENRTEAYKRQVAEQELSLARKSMIKDTVTKTHVKHLHLNETLSCEGKAMEYKSECLCIYDSAETNFHK